MESQTRTVLAVIVILYRQRHGCKASIIISLHFYKDHIDIVISHDQLSFEVGRSGYVMFMKVY